MWTREIFLFDHNTGQLESTYNRVRQHYYEVNLTLKGVAGCRLLQWAAHSGLWEGPWGKMGSH